VFAAAPGSGRRRSESQIRSAPVGGSFGGEVVVDDRVSGGAAGQMSLRARMEKGEGGGGGAVGADTWVDTDDADTDADEDGERKLWEVDAD